MSTLDYFINLMVRSTGVGVSISYNSSHRGQLDTGVDVSILLFTRLTEKQFLRTDIACGYCSHTLSSSNPLLLHLLSNLQYLLPSCSSSPPSPPLLLLLYLLLPLLLIFRCSQSPHPLTSPHQFLVWKIHRTCQLVSWAITFSRESAFEL